MKENRVATPGGKPPSHPSPEPAEIDDEGPEAPMGLRELRTMLAERDAATARFRELKRRLLRRR